MAVSIQQETAESIEQNLPEWEEHLSILEGMVNTARKKRKRREDSQKDISRWTYTSVKNVSCGNESCSGEATGFYRYTPRDNEYELDDYIPLNQLCETCFASRDQICARYRRFAAETPLDKAKRGIHEKEWVFVKVERRVYVKDIECMFHDVCNYDDKKLSDRLLCEDYTGFYSLIGADNKIKMCDADWKHAPFLRKENEFDSEENPEGMNEWPELKEHIESQFSY